MRWQRHLSKLSRHGSIENLVPRAWAKLLLTLRFRGFCIFRWHILQFGCNFKWVKNKWPKIPFKIDTGSVWSDLAKFRHFGRIFKVFGQCLEALLNICQNVKPIFANFYAFGQILIVANGQILKNDSSHLVTLVGDILFVACLFVHSFVVSVVIDLAIFERFCRQIFLQNVAQIVLKYLGYFL